jgi:hypothetical protein
MVGEYASQAGSIAANYSEKFFFLDCGTNDVRITTDSATTIYEHLQSIWSTARASGYKVIAFTVPQTTDMTNAQDTVRLALNSHIKSDSTLYDGLVRLDDVFSLSMMASTRWSVDGIHYSTEGHKVIGQLAFGAAYAKLLIPGILAQHIGASLLRADVLSVASTTSLAGNVGIGTTTPLAKLQVVGAIGSIFLDNNQLSFNRNPLTGVAADATKGSALISMPTSASGGNIQFFTNALVGGNVSERMRISESGNIGIGTTTPTDGKLSIAGTGSDLLSLNALGLLAQFNAYNNTDFRIINRSAAPITLWTSAAERVRIDSSGNVGIGTTTPNNKLDIYSATKAALGFNTNSGLSNWTIGQDASDGYKFKISSSTVLGTNNRFVIDGAGNLGIGTTTPYALLSLSNSASTAANTPLFVVASTTGGTATTTVFTIASTGNVTITGSAATCTLGNGASATSCSSSDERLKDDITAIDASSSLAAVEALRPVSFKWNQWMVGNGAATSTQFGFIAQEIMNTFPNLVALDAGSHYYKLDYQGLFAPIVGAVQALAQKVSDFTDSFTTKELTFTRATGDDLTLSHQLCVQKSDGTPVCVTGDQLAAVLAGASTASSVPANSGSSSNSATPDASATPDTTPPTITINGGNPAHISVGSSYADLGATVTDNVDKNLGLKYFLNGALVSDIVIDTSAAATDTIDYIATDTAGNTATSTRTVIVEAASIAQ